MAAPGTQLQQIQHTLKYYQRRLILQYRDLPKASATIAILLKQAVSDMILNQLSPAFDLSSAVGPQLDILGKYIGVPRNIGPATAPPYFGYRLAAGGGNSNGYTLAAGGVNTQAVYYRANSPGGQNTNLPDVSYQFILQLKVILNSCDGTLASIQNYLAMFFSDYVSVVDNQNMTLTYSVSMNAPVPVSVLQGYLPKPMGVGLIVTVVGATEDRVLADGVTVRLTSSGNTRVIQTT